MNTFASTLDVRVWDGNKMRYLNTPENQPIPQINIDYRGILMSLWTRSGQWMYDATGVFMLWTGHYDRNKKKIYEGDVKREKFELPDKDCYTYFVCAWIKEWARFAWLADYEYEAYKDSGAEELDHSSQESYGIFEDEQTQTVIVGNILEHPDIFSLQGDDVLDESD